MQKLLENFFQFDNENGASSHRFSVRLFTDLSKDLMGRQKQCTPCHGKLNVKSKTF